MARVYTRWWDLSSRGIKSISMEKKIDDRDDSLFLFFFSFVLSQIFARVVRTRWISKRRAKVRGLAKGKNLEQWIRDNRGNADERTKRGTKQRN